LEFILEFILVFTKLETGTERPFKSLKKHLRSILRFTSCRANSQPFRMVIVKADGRTG